MKRNKNSIFPRPLAHTLLASGCEEQIMEWKPNPTNKSRKYLSAQEQIMLYKPIKDYSPVSSPPERHHRHWGGRYISAIGLQSRGRRELHRHYLSNAMKMGVLMEIKLAPLTSQR